MMPKIRPRICAIATARWKQNLQRWTEHAQSEKESGVGTRKQKRDGKDRNYRRQRFVSHGRADRHPRSAGENALRRSFRRDGDWHTGRAAGGISGAAWSRAP